MLKKHGEKNNYHIRHKGVKKALDGPRSISIFRTGKMWEVKIPDSGGTIDFGPFLVLTVIDRYYPAW
jgi:hypothetical protein